MFDFALSASELAYALGIALAAGMVKGMVGFAMPMVIISGLSAIFAPEIALAGLILPTLVTNLFQAFAQGLRAAWQSIWEYRYFLVSFSLVLIVSAQLVRILPDGYFYLGLGTIIMLFACAQLTGWQAQTLIAKTKFLDILFGAAGGFIGGVSGIWGPTTVSYLTMIGSTKTDQMRVQGVLYGLGSVALLLAHIGSGIMEGGRWGFSAILILPAMIGLGLGMRINQRIDHAQFRKLTLIILIIAGANLIRRGWHILFL